MRTQSICLAVAIVVICPFASAQWVNTTVPYQGSVYAIAVSGTNLIAGTLDKGVFLSTNDGVRWTSVGLALTYNGVYSLVPSASNLFAVTSDDTVWRRPLSDMITSVHEVSGIEVLKTLSLAQNYPNPFNPTTTISFTLSSKSFVSLKEFDLLGREVATLVNEPKPAGTPAQEWNAVNVSSGIYLYRLQAGTFAETKKLLLLKVTRNSFVGAHHDVL